MKCVVYLKDDGDVQSESAGLPVTYRVAFARDPEPVDVWEGGTVVPWASSLNQMKTAIQAGVIKEAAGRGHANLTAQDMVIVGGLM